MDTGSNSELGFKTRSLLKIFEQRKQQHALTLISSRSKKFSMMPFLFQMIGGRRVPWMAQVRTALRPTVTVETLIRWSSARLSCTTSVGKEGMKENDKN